MKILLRKILSKTVMVFALVALLVVSVNKAGAAEWTAPTLQAPLGNPEAVITAGGDQIKSGGLFFGGNGDINADGKVNIQDLTWMINFFNNKNGFDFDEKKYAAGDISGDGLVDKLDMQLILDVILKSRTITEAHLYGKKQAAKGLSRNETGAVVIGTEGVKFADGSIQKTAFDLQNPDQTYCYNPSLTGNECSTGFYLKSATKCCPFSVATAAAGAWYSTVNITNSQGTNGGWYEKIAMNSFTTAKKITKMKITGSSDDGGYCYAFWGANYFLAPRQSEAVAASSCVYNKDNQHYPIIEAASVIQTYNTSTESYDYSCPAGFNLGTYFCDGTCYECTKTTPAPAWSADGNGNISICQSNLDAGPISSDGSVDIPAGTKVFLTGGYVNGPQGGGISCAMEVQYAN